MRQRSLGFLMVMLAATYAAGCGDNVGTGGPSAAGDMNAAVQIAVVQAPSNLTGICDHSIQSNIDAALAGTANINDVINEVEPRLWNMSTVLPILQDTTIVAAGPSVLNVSLSGSVPVGIVGDAGQWVKTPQ